MYFTKSLSNSCHNFNGFFEIDFARLNLLDFDFSIDDCLSNEATDEKGDLDLLDFLESIDYLCLLWVPTGDFDFFDDFTLLCLTFWSLSLDEWS